MEKVTVRHDGRVYDDAQNLWEGQDAVFESKSKFFRFSTEYALDQLLPEYRPTDEYAAKLEKLEDVDGAERAIMEASDPYFEAFDYATSMKRLLEDDESTQEDMIEAALERTYEFILSEFPESYAAQDLE